MIGMQPMEISPPYRKHGQVGNFQLRVTCTYDVVVLAANWGGTALGLTDADDVDGGTVGTDEGVQGRDDNAKECEQSCDGTTTIGLCIGSSQLIDSFAATK